MTENELLDFLTADHGPEGDPGAVTTTDLQRILGCGEDKARKVAHQMVEDGKFVSARFLRRNIHGETQFVYGFKVVT